MKKRLLNKIGRLVAGIGLLGASASAAQVTESPERGLVRIKFDEPIVSQTVAATAREARYSESFGKQLAPHDLGLDLFEVTGDPAHQPKVHWEDQNRLLIEPAEGTSVATEFRLAFKPGVTYLSGKELAQREFRFHAPDTHLSTQYVDKGISGTAVIVYPYRQITKEAAEFSATSPVEYTFVQQVQKSGKTVDGRTVAGKAAPLLFKYAPDKFLPGERSLEDMRAVGPDTVLPGAALVTPAEPLPYGTRWELRMKPASGSGLIGGEQYASPAYPELQTEVRDEIAEPQEKGQKPFYAVSVGFSHKVTEEAARQAFRDLEISIGGAKSTNTADGRRKTIETPQGTYTFTFDQLIQGDEETRPANGRRGGSKDDQPAYDWRYREPDAVAGFRMRVEAPAPALAEFTVKPGIAAKLGKPLTRDHVHRINLNPAWPTVDLGQSGNEAIHRLPFRGEHKMRLRSACSGGITATAYHWDAEHALQALGPVTRCVNAGPDSMHKYALAITTQQVRAGLEDKENFKWARSRQLEEAMAYAANRARLQGACAKAHKFEPQQLAADERGFCDCTEHVLDLDTLTVGNTKAGLYLIVLDIKPSAAVLAAAKAVGVEESDLTLHAEYAVMVSDLQLACPQGAGMILVSDRLTGKPVEAGRAVLHYSSGEWRKRKKHQAECSIAQGMARPLCKEEPEGQVQTDAVLVCAGEDYLVEDSRASESLGYLRIAQDDTTEREHELQAQLFCDNTLYRPGDTVHVRGVIRVCSTLSNTSLPKMKEATITVKKPSGEALKKETLAVDEFGCVAYDFTLPEGEEDVTGPYRILLADGNKVLVTCTVRAEVYRRDAFEFTAKCEVERVSPKTAKLCIAARDLNGAPLSNAKLHLRLSSDMKLDCAETVDATLDAKGCHEMTVKLSPKEGDTANSHSIDVTGTITNDREEVRRFSCCGSFHNADFYCMRDEDTLRLYDARSDEEKPLAREQKVHLLLKGRDVVERIELPNGFSATRKGEVTVWEGDLTVPANAEFSTPMKLRGHVDAYKKDGKPHELEKLELTISGTDPEGHSFANTARISEYELAEEQGKEEFSLVESKDWRSCSLSSDTPGSAFAIVASGANSVRSLLLPVECGKHPVDLKLTPQETGNLSVLAVMPVKDAKGLYTRYAYDSAYLEIPNPQRKLQVKLELPQDACRPGAVVKLGGSVSLPDGSPATAAVTFYAVDEGILSVSGGYKLPDLEPQFTIGSQHLSFSNHRSMYEDTGSDMEYFMLELMDGVWNGECISRKDDRGSFSGRVPNHHRLRVAKRAVCGAAANGDMMAMEEAAPAAAVPCVMDDVDGLEDDDDGDAAMPTPVAQCSMGDDEEDDEGGDDSLGPSAKPRLRTNFVPVAVWQASLPVDAQGRFETECTLPDTLTTYRVFAVAVDDSGNRFGGTEGKLQVNQSVMLTPGTPFFMSTGDKLVLPLTVTNNTDAEGTWKVKLDTTSDTQEIRLAAHATGTLKFEVEATQEGECTLNWTATAKNGADAVQGTFPVRFPAPLLKEAHHLALSKGTETLKPAALLAPELAGSTRGEMEIALSANPLLHLAGCMDFVLGYPYGCTEQTATGLLPWLLYDRLAPICPRMAETPPAKAHELVVKSIERILRRQKRDGGIGYWDDARESCLWASAHAAFVLDIAAACGYELPKPKWDALRAYLRKESQHKKYRERTDATTRFQVARVLRDDAGVKRALKELVREDDKTQEDASWYVSMWHPRSVQADLRLIADMEKAPAKRHEAFISWLRSRGHDYRHTTTWESAWTLIALHEYLRREPAANAPATVTTADGSSMTLGNGITTLALVKRGSKLGDCAAAYTCTDGTAYAVVRAKAQPDQTEYPGVVEKGLQITRLYEKKEADGVWRPARDFNVGDVVRVTLTCAKPARDLEYFVLEDYLPSCMEALNPAIPSQCAGLERCDWSVWFDHKEYLADRVRGFCTKWGGRDLLNMRYYARVKRAGTSTAPPAQAQLMYEPQMYGLSPNTVIQSK